MELYDQTREAIDELITNLLPYCSENETLLELKEMLQDRKKWREAHALFSRIREKMLDADRKNDCRLQFQYAFEEICAKTVYNLADHSAGFSSKYLPPFDEDSCFWVFPCAIAFVQYLGIKEPTRISRYL